MTEKQVEVATELREIAKTSAEEIPRTWAELDAFANQLVKEKLPAFDSSSSSPDELADLLGHL